MKPTWAEAHVLQAAGIPADSATDYEITLAQKALERCYYIDRAAIELCAMLDARRHTRG